MRGPGRRCVEAPTSGCRLRYRRTVVVSELRDRSPRAHPELPADRGCRQGSSFVEEPRSPSDPRAAALLRVRGCARLLLWQSGGGPRPARHRDLSDVTPQRARASRDHRSTRCPVGILTAHGLMPFGGCRRRPVVGPAACPSVAPRWPGRSAPYAADADVLLRVLGPIPTFLMLLYPALVCLPNTCGIRTTSQPSGSANSTAPPRAQYGFAGATGW